MAVTPIFFSWGEKGEGLPLTLERGAVACLARGWGALPLLWEDARLPSAGCKGGGRNKPAQDTCDDLPQTGRKSRQSLVRPV